MPEIDPRTAAELVAAPDTAPSDLAQIAAGFPELWDQIAVHPSAYPDLIAWIEMARAAHNGGEPSENSASAAPSSAPQGSAAPVEDRHRSRPRSRGRVPLIAVSTTSIIAIAAVVMALVIVNPFSDRRLEDLLALVGLPEDSQNFALDISYPDRVAEAMGSDLPQAGDRAEVSRWVAQAGEGPSQLVDLGAGRMSEWWIESYGSIPLHADAHATLLRRVCDPVSCEERELGVWAGDIPGELLEEGFSDAGSGELYPGLEGVADPGVLSLREGGVFHRSSWDLEDGMSFSESHHEGTLADDDEALRVLRFLDDTGGYAIGISRWGDSSAFTSGYAVGVKDDRPHVTLVADVRSESRALDVAETAPSQVRRTGDRLRLDLEPTVRQEGSLVILEIPFHGTADGLAGPRAALIRDLLGNLEGEDEHGPSGDGTSTPSSAIRAPDPSGTSEEPDDSPALPSASDPSHITQCETAPTFTVRSGDYADHSLRLHVAMAPACSAGDVLAGPEHHITIVGPSLTSAGNGLPVTIAQGLFDLSTPLVIPPDGAEVTLIFGPGQHFQDVTGMNVGTFTVKHDPGRQPTEPVPLVEGESQGRVITAVPPAHSLGGDLSPAELLQQEVDRDRPLVDVDLTGYWTPQLASGKAGSAADEQAFLEELVRQRAQYPSAKLLHSDDWPVFAPGGPYWVVIAGIPFETAEETLQWCADEGFDPSSCYAKRLDQNGTFEESTRYR